MSPLALTAADIASRPAAPPLVLIGEQAEALVGLGLRTSKIGAITNVDDLVNNTRLRTYVLDSAGLDTTFTSKAYLKQVLTSDLADPGSVANQAKNPAWKKLTGFFNFNADGTVNGQAQTADQTEDLKLDYVASMSTYPSATLLDANQRYWDKHVPQVQSAQDLVKDSRLVAYVKTAFGLNPTMLASSVASLMYSQNFAQTYGNTKLLDAFEFSSDGTLPAGTSAQTPRTPTENVEPVIA